MRLAIHELGAARDRVAGNKLPEAFKMLSRVARIFDQLNGAWDVLRTMTPSDYTAFRKSLGASSGFQSWQYRMIEFMLGNRNPAMLKPHQHTPQMHTLLSLEMAKPSLYDRAIEQLCAAFDAPVPEPDLVNPHTANPEIEALWKRVYEAPSEHWHLYDLAEKLVDLEDYFRRWRFNHVTTVERVIGFKRGTGGTAGVSYLRRMLEVELFPELWHVRGRL
jgi:tryptophan 2,3-dioxygenase